MTSQTEFKAPFFSIDRYDSDGDLIDRGIYLHYGDVSIRVARTINGFHAHLEHLWSIEKEIKENYLWEEKRLG